MKEAYTIAVVPGDGIGKEVCAAAVEVLQAVDSPLTFTSLAAGAECYRQTGDAFPTETLEGCRQADAILHGAAGLPDVLYDDGTEAGQDFSLNLRKTLDLYANIRPIRLYEGVPCPLTKAAPGSIDYVIVRENTEGLYAARGGGNLLGDQVATDTMVVTRQGVERVVRAAADLARTRNGAPRDGKRRVTIVDKSNVLRSYAFFRKVASEVLENYPDIETDFAIVDAMTVHMLARPDHFDVVVCENFAGDILSDLGAATVGGLGFAPSAETGENHGYFQASHGSAPDIAGQHIANPMATILSGAFMLQWLGQRFGDARLEQHFIDIRDACETVLREGRARTRDLGGNAGTSDFTRAVCDALAAR